MEILTDPLPQQWQVVLTDGNVLGLRTAAHA